MYISPLYTTLIDVIWRIYYWWSEANHDNHLIRQNNVYLRAIARLGGWLLPEEQAEANKESRGWHNSDFFEKTATWIVETLVLWGFTQNWHYAAIMAIWNVTAWHFCHEYFMGIFRNLPLSHKGSNNWSDDLYRKLPRLSPAVAKVSMIVISTSGLILYLYKYYL